MTVIRNAKIKSLADKYGIKVEAGDNTVRATWSGKGRNLNVSARVEDDKIYLTAEGLRPRRLKSEFSSIIYSENGRMKQKITSPISLPAITYPLDMPDVFCLVQCVPILLLVSFVVIVFGFWLFLLGLIAGILLFLFTPVICWLVC